MIKTIRTANSIIKLCANSQVGFDKDENQDSFSYGNANNLFAISVCDGLGSATHSAEGSKYAAEKMVECQLNYNKPLEFQKIWMNHFPDNKQFEYNTTARFIKIDRKYISYGGVGDGLIAFLKGKKVINQTSHGDFSNQTSSIVDPYFVENYYESNFEFRKECICLICTDGFSEDLEAEALKELLKTAKESLRDNKKSHEFDEAIKSLLENWPNKTNGDDKTIAFVLVRRI